MVLPSTPWWLRPFTSYSTSKAPPPPPPSRPPPPPQPPSRLWPLSGGRRGACRVEGSRASPVPSAARGSCVDALTFACPGRSGGNTGSFDEIWTVGEYQCQQLCAASPACVAIGYVYAGSARTSDPHPGARKHRQTDGQTAERQHCRDSRHADSVWRRLPAHAPASFPHRPHAEVRAPQRSPSPPTPLAPHGRNGVSSRTYTCGNRRPPTPLHSRLQTASLFTPS